MTVLTLALILMGAVAAMLAMALLQRAREMRRLRDLGERVQAVAKSGDLGERLAPDAGEGSAGEIAEGVDRLIERLQFQSVAREEREAIYRRMLETMNETMLVEREGIELANARFAELCGVANPAKLLGRRLADLVRPEYSELVAEYMRRHREGAPAPARLEVELPATGEGEPARLELSFARTTLEGRPAVTVTGIEMVPATRTQGGAQRSHASAWEALDSLAESVLTTDIDGRIVYVNAAGEQLIGKPIEEILGRTLGEVIELVDEGDRKMASDPVRQTLTTGTRVNVGRRGMLVSAESDGERSIEITVSPMRDAKGNIDGAVIALRDVTDLRGLTRALTYQASRDAMTGLINRREFERRLQEALEATVGGARHVLCYLDLDRFKAVNDECGHRVGDNMLREVATLIKDAVRDSDVVGRLGGDEFGVLLTGCPLEKARQIADDVVRAVADHRFVWNDKIFSIGVSIGLVEVTVESTALDDLLHAADSACYVAKNQGGHVHVYSVRDEAEARRRGEILWLQLLQSALKEDRFELVAQPIQHALPQQSGGPGLEVLLRLKDEKGVAIAPAEFMRAAERYRLMPHVDRWVVQTSLTLLARGAIRLAPERSLCINLSGQTLGDSSFLEFVVDCLDRTGVAPQRICFEVTENAVISSIEYARRFIGVLHGMGCQFALDDFGRGLSSLSNLKNLELDYLKIDGSFIRNLASDNVNQAMVTAMIKLARSLNFQVIAEQVEDLSALDSVRRMGVDFVQGYQVGRPMPLPLAS
ncbi:MAG: EAL domain-containing protein [Gammaproteobacteria bacterium]|nr:EAL domain-containing protein [Gammaproteobacteria bacterium]MDH5226483.1 EAL domain-containing protein [Gammaproteobacteria bacterium]